MFYKDEKLALFIDGSNLFSTAKALGFGIDFSKLHNEFMRRGKLLRPYYYTMLYEDGDHSPLRPLVDWLHYNGFTTVTKTPRTHADNRNNKRGNTHVELAVAAMEIAPHVNHIVLFSGDGDFTPLVASLQRQGVRVSVVSSMEGPSPMISDALRRQADNFIELQGLEETIGRPLLDNAED